MPRWQLTIDFSPRWKGAVNGDLERKGIESWNGEEIEGEM